MFDRHVYRLTGASPRAGLPTAHAKVGEVDAVDKQLAVVALLVGALQHLDVAVAVLDDGE